MKEKAFAGKRVHDLPRIASCCSRAHRFRESVQRIYTDPYESVTERPKALLVDQNITLLDLMMHLDVFDGRVCFSTEHLTDTSSVKKWQQFLSEVYCRQDVKMLSADRADGAISKRSLSQFTVSHFRAGGAHRVVRTKELAKLDRVEHFHFAFPRSGCFAYTQSQRDSCAFEGGAFILNASREFRIDFSADAASVVFAIPCDLMRKRIVGVDDFAASNTISDPLLIRMITSVGFDLLNVDTKADGEKIQELCVDMIALAVAAARGQCIGNLASQGVDGLFVERLRGVVSEKCSEPLFDLKALAATLMVSRRQIQKLLRDAGTTFSEELLDARLTKAAHLLKSKSSVTIGLVARQCGFVNVSHFSTSYRKRFGVPPREHRRPT